MLKNIFQYKKIRIGWFSFVIRKIKPEMFLENNYLLPFSSVIGLKKEDYTPQNEEKMQKILEECREVSKSMILASVVSVRSLFFEKKIEDIIQDIMDSAEVYNRLVAEIMKHTLNSKKKQ